MDQQDDVAAHDGETNAVESSDYQDRPEEEERSQSHTGDGASPGKIFVGGLARETTTAQFLKHFGKYGEIIDSVIMKDRKTGQPRGFGFVTYADPSVVDQLIQDTHIINGKQVEIKRTIPKGAVRSKDFKTKKIFVGGIPTAVTEDEFKDFFSQFGEVTEHQIMRDHSTNRSRGFGFVTFDSEQAVDDLLAKGSRLELAGAQVEVKKAEPKRANLPPPPSKRYNDSRSSFGSGYGAYDGFGGSNFGSSGGAAGIYRAGGPYGSRASAFGGYGGGEFGGYGGYGGGAMGSYRGETSLGYSSRYGGGLSRSYDFGGGYGGPSEGYGGYGGGGGGSGGYGGGYGGGGAGGYSGGGAGGYGGAGSSGYGVGGGGGPGSYGSNDTGLGSGYGGSTGSSLYGNRGGYGGGGGGGRYHPYSR